MGPIILAIEILFGLGLLSLGFASPVLLVLGAIYFIILFLAGVKIVRPQTVRTKEVFGKYTGVLRQGLNLVVPFVTITREQDLYRKNFSVEVQGVTHDNVTAYVGLNVIYYVQDDGDDSKNGNIYKSVYSIDDPRTMMRAAIDEQLRAMMVEFTHKEIFGKREEIGHAISTRLKDKLKEFGYTLDSIQVRDVTLDSHVMSAMNKVVETQKLKEAANNEAEAKKIMQVKEAEAEKESKILLGEGMAGQRLKIAQGFQESIEMIKGADQSLDAKAILDFLLDSSRIEVLGNIGDKDNAKLIYLNEDLEGRSLKKDKLIAGSDIM